MSSIAPFRLAPFFRTRPWGFQDLRPWYDYRTTGEPIGEVWLTGEMCIAETGPFAGHTLKAITAQHPRELLGEAAAAGEFPLLIKMLFPKEKLSVQVHPDDALAQKHGFPRGKTECWYALDAQPDASVALGLKPGSTPEQIRAAIHDATLEKYMTWLPVKKGDMIYVDAGTVHAIGPGAVILETQQTSDLTYRMYDYGSARELHVDLAMEAARMTTRAGKVDPVAEGDHSVLVNEHYFRVEKWPLDAGQAPAGLGDAKDRVQVLFCAEGSLEIDGEGWETVTIQPWQLAVIPARTSIRVHCSVRSEVICIVPVAI
uniref:Mannose-6-phosphate isomerase n=1 Tax=Acidobacterium capsulatum TaxID=33075 RepID=A0A7V4XT51_9BACT